MYNKVFLIGNLTRDPELRYTPTGIPVVRFTLAVGRPRSKKSAGEGQGSDEADFIGIVAWRRLAEICAEFLKKGKSVAIEGRLQIRSYEKDGVKRTISEVISDNMQMLGRKEQSEHSKTAVSEVKSTEKEEGVPEEEVPF